MSNLSSTYLKRSGGPGNDGMLVDLKMGKKRILELGNAIEATDAPNKKQLDYIANVEIPFKSANMTSNTTPSPFLASAPIESSSAWKAFSASEFYQANTTSQDISLTLDFGSVQRINYVEFELSSICDSITLFDDNNTVIDSKSLTGGTVLWKFSDVSTHSLRVLIVQVDELVRVSKTVIGLRTVNFQSATLVQTYGSSVAEAVNIAYLNDALQPITSSIVPVYVNPPMTSDSTPAPYSVECSVNALATHEPYMAYDYNFNTNFKAVAPSVSAISIAVNVPEPVAIAAFEVAGASDDLNITTNKFVLVGVKPDLSTETLYTKNTPLPQGPEIYQIQSDSVFVSFELYLFPIRAGVVVALNMCNIFTKAISVAGRRIVSVGDPINSTDVANRRFVDNGLDARLPLNGGTMVGNIDMGGSKIKNIALTNTTDKGDVMSRQSILTSDLPSPILGSVLAMSQGAILATVKGIDLNGNVDVVPEIGGTDDLIPNPTTGDYFGFNFGTNSIDILGGSYEVCLQLGFTDTVDVPSQVTLRIAELASGQILAEKVVQAQSSFVSKESLYITIQTQSSIVLKVQHNGRFTRLVGGFLGIYKPTIQSQLRRLIAAAKLNSAQTVGLIMTNLSLMPSNRIPSAVISDQISIISGSVSIRNYTGLVMVIVTGDVSNSTTTAQSVSFDINCFANAATTSVTGVPFGPFNIPSRTGTVNGVRPITLQCSFLCTGVPCTVSMAAKSSIAAGVQLSQFAAFVQSI